MPLPAGKPAKLSQDSPMMANLYNDDEVPSIKRMLIDNEEPWVNEVHKRTKRGYVYGIKFMYFQYTAY